MTCHRPSIPPYLQPFLEAHPPVLDEAARPAVTEETARTELDRYRLSLRRYDPRRAGLPWATQAQCPRCGDVVAAEFRLSGGRVVLAYHCPNDGRHQEVHHDNIFTGSSREETFGGSAIEPMVRELPRTVETLCPQCGCIILGRYYVRDGAVWIEKTCPDHGHFSDCINRDVRLFSKAAWQSFDEPRGLEHPHVADSQRCPSDCGLCPSHQSAACLANIDLTNRCNLNCPICFANANVAGYVYEPTFDQVVVMLQRLRDYRPIPSTCIQFSGGEPTLHPEFFRIVAKAADLGFSNIQIATNGLKMADPEFARKAAQAGLHTLYLQFDGVDDEVYRRTRGRPLMEVKLAAIENARKFDMKVCLVPTIVRGENDDQVGKILRFAAENADVISGISYQPVSFTGRIDRSELHRKRYTLGDLAHDIADASGADLDRDFFPLSFTVPFSEMLSVVCRAPKIQSSCHTECAYGTFFWVSPDKKLYPFPQVFDLEPLFRGLHDLKKKADRRGFVRWTDKLKALWLFYRHFRPDRAPKDLSFYRMVRSLRGMVNKKTGRGPQAERNYRTLMAAGMHFQDRYNFDCARIRRCVIHYSTPEGIFPFCTYNCGPNYRPLVEKMHARSAGTSAGEPAAVTHEPRNLVESSRDG
ncbi:MAG: radical SAM protein [Phycisphaerae bacterium]|nr:radical SAM protein [Phycisphaerae bacterium]